MSRVLLLIPSATYRAPDFMAAASRLGLDVVVGSDQRQALEALFPGRCLTVDLVRPEHGAAQIAAFAERWPISTIVAVDDGGTRVAAAAAERLGLPSNPVAAIGATRNKRLLRERLAAAGIPSPWFRSVATDEDPACIAGELPYPCVLKPLSLAASRGVVRADNAVEFIAAFNRVGAILSEPDVAADCGESAGELLVEAYIPGDEVALEGLLRDGELHVLALFDKPDPLVGPYFEETIYVTPSRLPAWRQLRVAEMAKQAVLALGLQDGPVHVELRLNDAGDWPIDIAARSIGGLCSRTLSFGVGMSLEELLLRHAIKAPLPSLERQNTAAGVMMIPIPVAGVLAEVHGLEAAREVEGIVEVTIALRPGQRLVPLPEGSEYFGFIFARGGTPREVEAALRAAHAQLEIVIARPLPDEPATNGAPLAAR